VRVRFRIKEGKEEARAGHVGLMHPRCPIFVLKKNYIDILFKKKNYIFFFFFYELCFNLILNIFFIILFLLNLND
jgi:hypothetical protein